MLFLSYFLAVKETMKLRAQLLSFKSRQEVSMNIPGQLHRLSNKEKDIDLKFKELNLGTSSRQNDLIKYLNRISTVNQVKIIEFRSPHLFRQENSTNKTHIFNLEGYFLDILKVVYALEKQGSFGAVSHISFEKKKDHRSGKNYLQALVFLEHIQ